MAKVFSSGFVLWALFVLSIHGISAQDSTKTEVAQAQAQTQPQSTASNDQGGVESTSPIATTVENSASFITPQNADTSTLQQTSEDPPSPKNPDPSTPQEPSDAPASPQNPDPSTPQEPSDAPVAPAITIAEEPTPEQLPAEATVMPETVTVTEAGGPSNIGVTNGTTSASGPSIRYGGMVRGTLVLGVVEVVVMGVLRYIVQEVQQ